MDTLVYISAAALVFVIVMVFVNARRVSDLRTEVENIPEPEGYTYRDSSIQTAAGGTLGPKKYYWLKIASVTVLKSTDAADKHEFAIMILDATATGTDNDLFTADVKSQRIGAIYRPEDNHLMAVSPNIENKIIKGFLIAKPKHSSLDFKSIPDKRHCTVVGLPPLFQAGTNS